MRKIREFLISLFTPSTNNNKQASKQAIANISSSHDTHIETIAVSLILERFGHDDINQRHNNRLGRFADSLQQRLEPPVGTFAMGIEKQHNIAAR